MRLVVGKNRSENSEKISSVKSSNKLYTINPQK